MVIKIQGYLIIVLATWLEICLANLDFIRNLSPWTLREKIY